MAEEKDSVVDIKRFIEKQIKKILKKDKAALVRLAKY